MERADLLAIGKKLLQIKDRWIEDRYDVVIERNVTLTDVPLHVQLVRNAIQNAKLRSEVRIKAAKGKLPGPKLIE